MLTVDARIFIENVVATADLGQHVDLNVVTEKFSWRTVDYKPAKFPGLVFRLRKPRTASPIFSTGKTVCTGARREEDARKAVRTVVHILRRGLGLRSTSRLEVKIENIVASGWFGGVLTL